MNTPKNISTGQVSFPALLSPFLVIGVYLCSSMALFLLFSSDGFAQSAPATNTGQIKKNILKNKKDLAAIKKRLKEEQRIQRLAHAREKSVLSHLQKDDQVLAKLRREKEANAQDLLETRLRIDRLQGDMQGDQEQLAQSRHLLKQRLSALYRMSFRTPLLGGLLDSESFGDFTRKLKFELTLAKSNEKLLSQTLVHEQRLEQYSVLWSGEKNRKQRIFGVLGRQEANYSIERKKHTIFLASIQRQKETSEQMSRELNQAAHDLQNQVSALLQQAEAARVKQKTWVSVGKGLAVKRGKIPWPVSGEIISFFGRSKNKTFNEVVDNSGIQIQAPMKTPIHAVAEGLVRYADWFKGYGKLVILDHSQGYYSLYAQASELNVSEGQTVAAGQVIGTVGDTGSLFGSSLYFEIRRNGVPQDPSRWLTSRK